MDYQTLSESDWSHLDRVWELVDDGDAEHAALELRSRFRGRLDHPDVRVVDAAVSLEEGDPERALIALTGAERSADPALFFHLRAMAHFDLCEFAAARDDAQRALAIRPDLAESLDLLSRASDHLGEPEAAANYAEAANVLDPERFPEPLEFDDGAFDTLVERSLAELPEPVQRHLRELPVLVEPLPSAAILTAEKPPLSPDLLGMFVGRDLMSRTSLDPPAAPGAIYLFRRNLLRFCHTIEELEHEVRVTVQHEVGHLLGLDENDLEEWGLA
jgi:predicted Zn-dependent protease with MMP-like domain